MTTRAKELANKLRIPGWEGMPTVEEKYDIAAHLDAKDAIDSAAPGEVREIQERHEQDLKDAKVSRVAARSWTDAHNDRATLLAIVQRQVGEVATLTTNQETIRACLQDGLGFKDWTGQHLDIEWLLGRAGTEYRSRVRLQQQLDAARAEVERLKGELHDARTAELNALTAHESTIRRHSEFAQRHTSMEAQLVTELTAQTDKLRSERSSLAAENARLVSEHAAAMARADVLAEGVRLYWGDNGWNAAAALEWKRKHGHLVGDGK